MRRNEQSIIVKKLDGLRRSFGARKTTRRSLCAFACFAFFWSLLRESSLRGQTSKLPALWMLLAEDSTQHSLPVLQNCTAGQRETILFHLPAEVCKGNKNRPWNNRCSFSYATRCPDSVWLRESYRNGKEQSFPSTAIFVGCNKAMDAVNALRMLSGNPRFDKDTWRNVLFEGKQGGDIEAGRCGQEHEAQFMIANLSEKMNRDNEAIVHCIEAMPITAFELNKSAHELRWQDHLVVHNAAVADQDGSVLFPNGKIGVENMGIGNCKKNSRACKQVPMYRLDSFAQKFLHSDQHELAPIDFISIDVEGYDYDVILGATNTLQRTKYLEFEYNWKGHWQQYNLSVVIENLYNAFGFICYWAGSHGNIWRITSPSKNSSSSCFLDHYNLKFWSNVACVNPLLAPAMARRMEVLFQETLRHGKKIRFLDESTANTDGRIV